MKIVFYLLLCAVVYVMAEPERGCPDQDAPEPEYIADKELCGTYYECYDGKAWLRNCNPGTYFNRLTEKCEFNVDCGSKLTTTTTKATPTKYSV